MNVIDIIIILFILLGGVAGFKAGVLKKIVSFVGLFIVVYLSFRLKNYLSPFIYENLPFFNFWGIFKGIQVLNIIFYEFLSFIIIASLLSLIYNVLLKVTGILENVLKATVILSIPSKLLGIIVGMIEEYIWVFIALVVFTLPVFHFNMISESKLANFILNNTPFLSGYATKSVEVYNDIYEVIDNRQGKTNYEVNKEALIILLDNKVITIDSVDILVRRNKIELEDTSFLDNYREGKV
ncbi:MAG: CvpA family protein [Bacilli bacterium]|nr:CvpA family protein [Clostridium sp.]MDY3798420.1 CvpA family protein [Bacilli bacterium]